MKLLKYIFAHDINGYANAGQLDKLEFPSLELLTPAAGPVSSDGIEEIDAGPETPVDQSTRRVFTDTTVTSPVPVRFRDKARNRLQICSASAKRQASKNAAGTFSQECWVAQPST